MEPDVSMQRSSRASAADRGFSSGLTAKRAPSGKLGGLAGSWG